MPPSTVINLTVAETTGGAVRLAWAPPLLDGSWPLAGYIVEQRVNSSFEWQFVFGDTPAHARANTSVWLALPAHNTSMEFGVRAVNTLLGDRVTIHAAADEHPTAPAPPVNVTVLSVTGGMVRLRWQQPVDSGGTPLLGYRVTAGAGVLTVTRWVAQATYTVPEDRIGVIYYFSEYPLTRLRRNISYGIQVRYEAQVAPQLQLTQAHTPPAPPSTTG